MIEILTEDDYLMSSVNSNDSVTPTTCLTRSPLYAADPRAIRLIDNYISARLIFGIIRGMSGINNHWDRCPPQCYLQRWHGLRLSTAVCFVEAWAGSTRAPMGSLLTGYKCWLRRRWLHIWNEGSCRLPLRFLAVYSRLITPVCKGPDNLLLIIAVAFHRSAIGPFLPTSFVRSNHRFYLL